ncbi:uncharacterized [Tachysurus ichikawai]
MTVCVRSVNGPLSKNTARTVNNFRSTDLTRDSSSPAGSSVSRFTGSSQRSRASSENGEVECGRDPDRKSNGNEPALEMESIVLYAEVLIQLKLPTPSPLPESSARYHNTVPYKQS